MIAQKVTKNLFILFLIIVHKVSYCAVAQILNDTFFPNPAELNTIHTSKLSAGNVFINPVFNFNGTSYGAEGSTNSHVNDYLPYLLSAYRFTDKLVLGFNVLPSMYGHLDWPIDSFVSQASTLTKLLYYRLGFQSSYQFNEDLALGLGFNLEDNAQYQLNFVVPGQGNQINSVTGVNYTGNFGFYYKLNKKNYLTIAAYTQVNTYGHGTSSLGSIINNNLSLNITEAPVIYLGLEHFINEKWFLESKIYWSGWSIQKNIDFTNTTTGTYVVPTNWKDVLSFQATTRYVLTEKYAILGSIIYETNPVAVETNAIGYPLAASGSLSGGLDVVLTKEISLQGIYSYGAFLSDSPINTVTSHGMITARFQAGVIQFVYKT
ncbi:MAG: hypothetical protein CK424_07275 [Legionella sp.]|nr:MAG: hypothetical protein CK424_07275 [Legionella sp.]